VELLQASAGTEATETLLKSTPPHECLIEEEIIVRMCALEDEFPLHLLQRRACYSCVGMFWCAVMEKGGGKTWKMGTMQSD
jgi:hypothetical protein